jgi:hypothetical protein
MPSTCLVVLLLLSFCGFFCFCGSNVWTLVFMLLSQGVYCLSHTSSLSDELGFTFCFCSTILDLKIEVLLLLFPVKLGYRCVPPHLARMLTFNITFIFKDIHEHNFKRQAFVWEGKEKTHFPYSWISFPLNTWAYTLTIPSGLYRCFSCICFYLLRIEFRT